MSMTSLTILFPFVLYPRVLDKLFCGGPKKDKYMNLAFPVSLGSGRTWNINAFSLNTTTPPIRKKHLFKVVQEHPFMAIARVTIKGRTRLLLHLGHVALQP